MNKQKVIEAIHNLGGCDATEEWSKGYDAGITAALDAIEKIPDTDNNADLISRSELQSEIAKGVGECRIRAFEPSVNCILQIIHRLPSADVQPVKRGRWITKAEDYYKVWQDSGRSWDDMPYFVTGLKFACSNCFEQFDVNAEGVEKWNGCPLCLVRMDGDKE